MSRFTAAHRENRLMLLGSPPDMVRSALSHRTRSFVRYGTQITSFIIIDFFKFYNTFAIKC